MEQEHVDPVYKYVDGKINLLNRKLQRQASVLERMQRFMANTEICSEANACRDTIEEFFPDNTALLEQLTAKLSLAYKEVRTSADPLSVAAIFRQWATSEQKKLGIKFVDVPK